MIITERVNLAERGSKPKPEIGRRPQSGGGFKIGPLAM